MGKNVIISTLPNISQNYLPKVNTSNIFANSLVYDNGTNVGIGTPSPDLTLTVNGAINMRNSTRAGAFEITSGGDLWMGTATTAGNIYLETGHSTTGLPSTGTPRMTITGGGNVGIGTPSPSGKLDVYATGTDLQTYFSQASSGNNNFTRWTRASGPTLIAGVVRSTNDGNQKANTAFIGTSNAYDFLLYSGDLERMRITSAGDMYLTGRSTNGDYGMYFYSNDTDSRIYSSNSGAVSKSLIFYTSGNPRMTITSGGNVGIGTASPDVTGFGYTTLTIKGGTTAGYAGVLELQTTQTTTNGQNIGIMAFLDGTSRNAQIGVQRDTSTSTANMMFYTNAGAGIVERMRITSGGNVLLSSDRVLGINTSDGSDNGYLALVGAGADGETRGGLIYLSGNERSADAGTVVLQAGNVGNGTINFRTGASVERMRITSGGNVLIGTTSDNGDKFQVTGTGSYFKGTSTYNTLQIDNSSTSGGGGIYFRQNGTIGGGIGLSGWWLGGTSNDLFLVAESGRNIRFHTNASSTESMRITSGGQVNIGGTNTTIWTSTSSTINQVSINNTDYPFAAARASNIVAILNRTTSNGVILEFKYDGAVVGSVSTNANSLPSDLNFKKDITNISLGLNLVSKLRPVHYRHKMDEDNEALSNGIIAQEMEQALLDCGIAKNSLLMLQHKPNNKENESQYWVDYTKMIPILTKAIQELSGQIEELKSKLN